MRILKFTFFFLFCLFIISCTNFESRAHAKSINSFLQIRVETTVTACKSEKNQNVCMEKVFGSVGSGSVVHSNLKHSYVLTAAHVCLPSIEIEKQEGISFEIKTKFTLINNSKKTFEAIVHRVPKNYTANSPVDLCILETTIPTKMPRLSMSIHPPKVGDTVYNIAAPLGFFFPPSVPIFSGIYSGEMSEFHSLITVPSIGGSSGSPVLNKSGKIVGVLFAANPSFHHLSIVVNHKTLKKFIIENLYR